MHNRTVVLIVTDDMEEESCAFGDSMQNSTANSCDQIVADPCGPTCVWPFGRLQSLFCQITIPILRFHTRMFPSLHFRIHV
jgi:hypothetical protein